MNEWMALSLMKEARAAGITVAEIREVVFECRNWSEWRESMEEGIRICSEPR